MYIYVNYTTYYPFIFYDIHKNHWREIQIAFMNIRVGVKNYVLYRPRETFKISASWIAHTVRSGYLRQTFHHQADLTFLVFNEPCFHVEYDSKIKVIASQNQSISNCSRLRV